MGPKKPRRTNLNEVLKEYQLFAELNEDTSDHHEPRKICLETCFTTFPDSNLNSVPIILTDHLPEATTFRKEIKNNEIFSVLDKNKNLDRINVKCRNSIAALRDIAPLAQPELFSDTSSTSSADHADNKAVIKIQDLAQSPKILKAPQMMRRTPKIIGNLNTCTEDVRNMKTFEKLAKTGKVPLDHSNSSSNVSYTSGASNRTNGSNDCEHFVSINQCSWKREHDISQSKHENNGDRSKTSLLAEELLEEILEYADCADFFKSDSSFLNGYDEKLFDTDSETNCDIETDFKIPTIRLTKSTNPSTNSPLILSPCSLEIDPDVISNYAIDLNLDHEHRSLLSHQNLQSSILRVSQIDAYHGSPTPPCAKTVTFSPDVLSIDDLNSFGASSDHFSSKEERSRFWNIIPFRYFNRKVKETSAVSLPNITKTGTVSTIYSNSAKKRSIDQIYTRNEALPLLNTASSEQFHADVFHKRTISVNSQV